MAELAQPSSGVAQLAPIVSRLVFAPVYRNLLEGKIDTRYTIITGGRGSGKSFAISAALGLMLRQPGTVILFTRYTLTSAKDSIIPEFREKLALLQIEREFTFAMHSISHIGADFEQDSRILFRGIKTSSANQIAKLKSLQGVNVWVLDEATELPDEETFDTIDLSVRDGRRRNAVILVLNPAHKSHWIYRRWFDGLPPEFNGQRDGVTYLHSTYEDVAGKLPGDFLSLAERLKEANPLRYRHVWRGHWAEQAEGALWTWAMIDRYRLRADAPLPELARIVVGVDPAVTSSDASDETGIVCAGLGMDGHYYVLSDLTRRASPKEWATAAAGEFRLRKADRIVAEVNNGGEMVEATLRAVDPALSYQAVHASRGKMIRAEPVAALYEQGLVHHVAAFPALETELMTYAGASNQASPNRLDALVWAMTALMESGGRVELFSGANAKPATDTAKRGTAAWIDMTPSERRASTRSYADVY